MARLSKQDKLNELNDTRIEKIYYETCSSGIQISIWDIPKVFAAGRAAITAGADDKALAAAIMNFVQNIRVN